MAIVVKDRVKVTTSTTGTGTLTLGSAESGFQAFSVIGDGNQTYYAIKSDAGFEVGIGTYTNSGTTLSRDTILESSNSGSAVSLTGTSTVFTTYPAERSSFRNVGVARDYTASGSITAGKPLILNTNNTVTQIASSGNNVTEGVGTANQFNGSYSINYPSSSLAKVADDKVAVTYRDSANSNYGVVQIATVDDSGRTISFGTKVVINSVTSNGTGVAFDTSNSVVGATVQTESDPKLIVANFTVSGTTLTKQGSSLSLITSDEVKAHTTFFDPDNNHIMVFLVYVNGSDRTFRAVAVTGNSSGTPTSSYLVNTNVDTDFFDTGNPFLATYDTNVNAFFITVNKSEPSTFRGIVVTNNGSALTATERSKTKPTNYKNHPTICFDSNNNKVVLAYNTTGNYNEIVNITMTTNDFTLGTPTSVTSLGTGASDSVSSGFLSFDSTAQRIVLLRGGGGVATSRWAVFSNDGTNFTQQSTGVWDSSTNNFAQRGGILQTAMTTNMTSNPIPIVMNNGNTGYGYSAVFTVGQSEVSNLDDNYIGIASSSASDTEAVGVNRPGSINIDQTGLTAGKDYYAKGDGTIVERTTTVGSTTTVNASQFVGTARSSTDLELAEPPIELVGTADGSITKGKPVILKTDGDIQQVGAISTSVSYSAGTSSVLDDDEILTSAITYDSDKNYFVAFYQETNFSNYGYARTFTVSDKAITMVQSLGAFHTNTTKIVDACYIGNSKHIVFYTQENSYLEARVVEIASDGTGTFGTANTIYSNQFYRYGSCYYDSDKDVAVITGMATSSYNVSAQACTVSGTTITAGTMQSNGEQPGYSGTSSSYDSGQKIGLVAFETAYGSDTDLATISLSGTGNRTVTWNSRVEVNSNGAELSNDGMAYDPVSQKHLLCFNDDADSYLRGIVITVSGTTPSFGTEALINAGQVNRTFACGSTNQGGFTIAWRDHSSPYYLKGVVATISGTSFNLTNSATLDSRAVKQNPNVSVAYQPSDFTNVVAYVDNTDTELYGVCVIPEGTADSFNLTDSNFIGFAQQTVSDNEDVKVATIGQTDDNQSSLTPVSKYYVQENGTLSTTADNPSVLAGTALTSTKILIKS